MPAKWFGPKVFGVGISPRTWQGWLATCVYLGLVVVIARFPEPSQSTKFLLLALVSAGFFGLVWLTCERQGSIREYCSCVHATETL